MRVRYEHCIYLPQPVFWKPLNGCGLEAFADVNNNSPGWAGRVSKGVIVCKMAFSLLLSVTSANSQDT